VHTRDEARVGFVPIANQETFVAIQQQLIPNGMVATGIVTPFRTEPELPGTGRLKRAEE
jgi:hypothetical protein